MPHRPAFPTVEVTRQIGDPGLSAHEYATIKFMAALLTHDGATHSAESLVEQAGHYADAVLARRVKP